MERLVDILRLRRRHASLGEVVLTKTILEPYIGQTLRDPKGDVLAYTYTTDEASKTLFSCHIDTITLGGSPSETQTIFWDEPTQTLSSAPGETLGADDGAGVWLLLEMIDAGVPGTYIFHRGEECGGIGSSGIAEHHGAFLKRFSRAIAFDRRATHSVITHQGGRRCCSTAFAEALAGALGGEDYFFSPDDGGSFTDTKNYVEAIPECTNVSVGYDAEHSNQETLDVAYLFYLRDKCISVAWEDLPTERAAGSKEFLQYSGWQGRQGRHGRRGAPSKVEKMADDELLVYASGLSFLALMAFCEDHPYEAATVLQEAFDVLGLYVAEDTLEVDDHDDHLQAGLA